jgi:metallophosphoesterase (TIGR03768 family)
MKEFFATSSQPVGHGFNRSDASTGFACYSFVPKSTVPIKVIVLDDTQREDDGSTDIHGHGFLDQRRWDWLRRELAEGQASGQLMIIAAHVPIGVEKSGSEVGWWDNARNAATQADLISELQSHPNFILWLAGHRHLNNVKAFAGATPESSFWQVETSSLRDFPQQFRTFEIYLNSDHTISIVTTNVDPAVKDGTPAAKSRSYAVATQQIIDTNVYNNNPTGDPSVKPMPTGSYNAELVVQLSPEMQASLQNLGTPASA